MRKNSKHVCAVFLFFFFKHPFQIQNQQKQTEHLARGAGNQEQKRRTNHHQEQLWFCCFQGQGMSKFPPRAPTTAGAEQTFPSESKQSSQVHPRAHPHVPSCAQHPWANPELRTSARASNARDVHGPHAHPCHPHQGHTPAAWHRAPKRCPASNSTAHLDCTKVGQRPQVKTRPGSEETPRSAKELQLHEPGQALRLGGHL